MELKKITTPKKIEALKLMGIETVEEVLTHYPFRYENHEQVGIEKWQEGDKIFTSGKICSQARVLRFKGNKSMTRFNMLIEEEEFICTIFNRPWTNAFVFGKEMTISGTYQGSNKITLTSVNAQPIETQLGLIPVYSTNQSLSQKDWKKIIDKALVVMVNQIEDKIPEEYRLKYKLLKRKEALYFIHHPKNQHALTAALRTLKYEEFLLFQCCMQVLRHENMNHLGIGKEFSNEDVFELMNNLPYDLTNDQRTACEEILEDLHAPKCMMRLLQGDVGCGKTLVAAICMYACVLSNRQACMMAPTEILAKQHYKNLIKTFKNEDIKIEVLYSALPKKKRNEILERLKNGDIDMLVGTHALFQEDVEYANLGVVIADEQHRFGVEQRRKLINKGDKVDFLLMSATPIPRTLAVSLYGDMDVSTIEDMPVGRKTTITTFINEDSMRQILYDVLEKVDDGEQCYIVCPAIEKNEEYEIRNVEELYMNMNRVLGKKYSLGFLHGKLSSEEKEQVMEDFLNKKYQFLIATTVIEVGVDVKDANIMIIYDAHRFGMSQIHQLRGRVGRGERQGYCYLLSGTKEKDAIERLTICANTSNGFEIASKDLMLRGCGDLLGIRQSGMSSFLLGDIVLDYNILETARKDAITILANIEHYDTIRSFVETIDYTEYLD